MKRQGFPIRWEPKDAGSFQGAERICLDAQRRWVWERLLLVLELTKVRISLFAMLTTVVGYILARGQATLEMLVPTAAIFSLACGSCALNQYQEYENDQRMERTQGRPIPSGRLYPSAALKISLVFLFAGFILLLSDIHPMALGLGGFAVFWYNGVYTPLKKKTAFAVIPGSVLGAIPPVLGWISGKDYFFFSPQIIAIALFFFMWQVPHFCLLLLSSGKDYEKGGFPSLTRVFTAAQLGRMTFVWITATVAASIIMPLFGVATFRPIWGGLWVGGCWLIWKSFGLVAAGNQKKTTYRLTFNLINRYALFVMSLFVLDGLFH